MNGNYFQNPTFPTNENKVVTPPGNINTYQDSLPMEQSFIENILRLNKGKKVKAYVSYPDSTEWQNKVYNGIIEEAGRDHLIISDPVTGNWYLIRMIYLDYVEFDERISYSYPYSEKTF
ncbi:MAG: spore coat protein GerQ [Bacilli bacterium]|nr:spore coat protein GerQ [Bacilli bacterium]